MSGIAGKVVGGIAGGLLGKIGADSQNDMQLEMMREARELPDWAKPYFLGQNGYYPMATPTNYNWMNWANNPGGVAGGMPMAAPPMSMNDPRMTFNNVYTPVAGGPWGYGMGPGQLTTEVGIPGGPGSQYIQPGENFTPGPTNTAPPPQEDPTGLGVGLSAEMLRRAQAVHRSLGRWERDANEGYGSPIGMLDILAMMMENPEADNYELFRVHPNAR